MPCATFQGLVVRTLYLGHSFFHNYHVLFLSYPSSRCFICCFVTSAIGRTLLNELGISLIMN